MSDESTRVTGSATTTVNAPIGDVFTAVTDVTRIGEWSPECVGCRWVGGATGPAVGARFEGDNVAAVGPVTLKRWTTTSEVVAFEPNALFEFVAEGHTSWRYEFVEPSDGADDGADATSPTDATAPTGVTRGTVVTESFSFPPYVGWQKWVYGRLVNRPKSMTSGVQATLARLKAKLEA